MLISPGDILQLSLSYSVSQIPMIVIIRHLFYRNYVGLSFWPFIILKADHLKDDIYLLNHERIHLKQQIELLVIPFYIFYIFEWVVRCCYYFNGYKAYQNLSFEREAFLHEKDLDYLQNRKAFSFLKYM